MAAADAITDRAVAIEAWRRLSEVNANMQRWDEAISAIEKALFRAPDSRHLRLARALLLGQQGNDAAALAALESLAREAADSPGLMAHLAAQLAAAGRVDEAEAQLVGALDRWPVEASLHTCRSTISLIHPLVEPTSSNRIKARTSSTTLITLI